MIHIKGVNTKSIITEVEQQDIQSNAIDLKLGKVFRISNDLFEITNDSKKMRTTFEVIPDQDDFFNLDPGVYEIVMTNVIGVSDSEAGWVITRSTLNRNGIHIFSGLYDSFYGMDVSTGQFVGGVMAGCLHVNCGPARIKRGTRVGQFLLFSAEMLHRYDGSYGNHKDHDKKYS